MEEGDEVAGTITKEEDADENGESHATVSTRPVVWRRKIDRVPTMDGETVAEEDEHIVHARRIQCQCQIWYRAAGYEECDGSARCKWVGACLCRNCYHRDLMGQIRCVPCLEKGRGIDRIQDMPSNHGTGSSTDPIQVMLSEEVEPDLNIELFGPEEDDK